MTLPDPTSQQAALVSVVTGAMTGAFAVWMNHEGKNPMPMQTPRRSEPRK